MERLYLVRHGIAVPPGTPGIADGDRPLTPRGRRRTRRVARGLEALGLEVDRIVTSPLPRALETAEIVAAALGLDDVLEMSDALAAERSAGAVAEWLATRGEGRLMLVGHNPWISDLVGLLCTGEPRGAIELRKAGVAALAGLEGGAYALDWLARPGLLRRLG
jgi:phosphohistidine phosphatase